MSIEAYNLAEAGKAGVLSDSYSGETADQVLALGAKALAHPARVKILRYLLGKNVCFCGEIVQKLPLAQSTVSQHLKVLKEAGLICGKIEGPARCYCVNPNALKQLKILVAAL